MLGFRGQASAIRAQGPRVRVEGLGFSVEGCLKPKPLSINPELATRYAIRDTLYAKRETLNA